jgi:hypothetical protein
VQNLSTSYLTALDCRITQHKELEIFAQPENCLSQFGVFESGERVMSATLPDLTFDLDRLFAE